MQFDAYRQIQFISGPFQGLLGKTLRPAGEGEDANWYVEVMFAGRPVIQEVPAKDIKYTS